jgi:hypothetical protein
MITLDYEFEVTNPTLRELIDKKQAAIVMQVNCSSTFYSKTFDVYDLKNAITIPCAELREKVFVYFYVCALEDLPDYLPVGSHPDYEGFSFAIEKGDVLAVGNSTSFIAEKTFDPLNAPLNSLFRIQSGTHKNSTRVDLDQDKILITLPEDDYRLYWEAFKRKQTDLIHVIIVYPVLIEALNIMNGPEGSDYEPRTWYERINQICIDRAINREEALSAAQAILANPLGRGLKQLNDQFSMFENEE